MQTDITRITVGEIVKQDFRTAAVFEKFNIDYCCGGDVTLGDSCASQNLDIKEVVTEIGKIKLTASGDNLPDFDSWDVTFLCDYLERVHHTYVRKNVPEIKELSAKVADAHGDTHPFTLELAQKVHALGDDLLPHLLKEENILFPYLRHLWDVKSGKQDQMQAPFGRAANPIRVMEADHDNAGDLLKGINAITDNFTIPEEACNTWIVLYKALRAFEKDLHTHIHLENNVLFPKAIALEDEMNG